MHVMVDLETMGTAPGSVIASIGAVAFDPEAGTLGRQFYQSVDIASAVRAGLSIDPETVKWWLGQGDEARGALLKGQVGLRAALEVFAGFWVEVQGAQFWSHGANFDEPVLGAAFRACGLRTPWRYSASRCTRTLFQLAGVDVADERTVGAHHNALDDAVAQAKAVCWAWCELGLAPDSALKRP